MLTWSSLGTARFTSGQVDYIVAPRVRRSRRLVLACHGAGADGAAQWAGAGGQTAMFTLAGQIAAAGYVVAAASGVDLWGNTTAMGRLTAAAAYARANLGASSDPALVVGVSMGNVTASRWAYTTPADCAAVVGVIPAIDVAWIRPNDPEGLDSTAAINTALGITDVQPVPAANDPAQFAGDLDVPIQLWTASDDDVSHGASTFAAATGAELHDLGALGHTNTAIAAVTASDVLTFLEEN